jgi:hypothetical protein
MLGGNWSKYAIAPDRIKSVLDYSDIRWRLEKSRGLGVRRANGVAP